MHKITLLWRQTYFIFSPASMLESSLLTLKEIILYIMFVFWHSFGTWIIYVENQRHCSLFYLWVSLKLHVITILYQLCSKLCKIATKKNDEEKQLFLLLLPTISWHLLWCLRKCHADKTWREGFCVHFTPSSTEVVILPRLRVWRLRKTQHVS